MQHNGCIHYKNTNDIFSIALSKESKIKTKGAVYVHQFKPSDHLSGSALNLIRLAHGNRPIRHTKIRSNRLLATDATSSLCLRARQPTEKTNLQHARDQIYPVRQRRDFPDAMLTRSILALRDVGGQEEFRERCVDEEEALVGFYGLGMFPFFFHRGTAKFWEGAAELFELGYDAAGG